MRLQCWRSSMVERRKGGVHGLSLFAVQPIPKNDLIAIKAGKILDEDFIMNHTDIVQGSHMQLSDNFFIGPTTAQEHEDTLIGFNHSCEPNAYVQGQVLLLAMRDIAAQEEVTVDYTTCYTSDTQEFNCLCGKPTCRKHIKPSVDWRDLELQQKYSGYFAYFVQSKISNKLGV